MSALKAKFVDGMNNGFTKRAKANSAQRKKDSDWCNEQNQKLLKVLGGSPLGQNDCPACGNEFSNPTSLQDHLKSICPEIGFSIEGSYSEAYMEALFEGRIGIREVFLYSTDFHGFIRQQEKPYGTKMVILPPRVKVAS